jgi:hypothetical protein
MIPILYDKFPNHPHIVTLFNVIGIYLLIKVCYLYGKVLLTNPGSPK